MDELQHLFSFPCAALALDDTGKCTFNDDWLFNKHSAAWLKSGQGNVYEVQCVLYRKRGCVCVHAPTYAADFFSCARPDAPC